MTTQEKMREELRAFLPPTIYKNHQVDILSDLFLSKLSEREEEIVRELEGRKKPKSKKKSNSFPSQRAKIFNRAIDTAIEVVKGK